MATILRVGLIILEMPALMMDGNCPSGVLILLSDTVFSNTLNCRWQTLRTNLLDTLHIFNYIDSIHNYINQAQTRNFQQWPILGVYVWSNPAPIPQTYAEEINSFKKWFRNLFAWLYNNMPGQCLNNGLVENIQNSDIVIYPNPAYNLLNISFPSNTIPIRYKILDVINRTVQEGIFELKEACRP